MKQKLKLYVLDDDEQYAGLLAEVARNSGWQVDTEQSPIRFLEMDKPEQGILVLDLVMPEMDGIEVIRNLALQDSKMLLILVSGFDARVLHSAQQLAEAHNMEVLATLTKPVGIHDFVQVLSSIEHKQDTQNTTASSTQVSVAELQSALANHQLVLFYQPQINLQNGKLHGVEALVRWQHPQKGMIFPDQFIALAEEHGLIDALTEEVLQLAVGQSRKWQAMGKDIVISVNVSADNITSLKLPEQLKKLTDSHAIEANKIVLELTESAVMGELTSSLDVLNRLRMKGFSLSIDDFGTGHSSFTQLYQAPFSEIKIDKSFVMRMQQDREARVIVKICIMLGHMLETKLVAEGVENAEIMDELRQLGCDYAQGYHIAKPMPAEELIQWLEQNLPGGQ